MLEPVAVCLITTTWMRCYIHQLWQETYSVVNGFMDWLHWKFIEDPVHFHLVDVSFLYQHIDICLGDRPKSVKHG